MIGKKGKVMIALYLIFLVILFLMCSTDLIIREPEKEVYEVAVIIEDTVDDNYNNFRKGMDQAAIELNADVRFITLYEKLNAEGQMELIERERQDGVDALIVAPVDEEQVQGLMSDMQGSLQTVLLSSGEAESVPAEAVVIDYREMGKQMAEEMQRQIPADCPVLMPEETQGQSQAATRFLEGASEVLEGYGHDCQIVYLEGEEAYRNLFGTVPESGAAILAGSPETLLAAADALENTPALSNGIKGVYGRGNTLAVLDDLDSGLITGICVTDEFSRGYFSVCRAVEALEGKAAGKPLILDSYYIEKEDLRGPVYEKMLYPVE